jgi:hypothetical protein
MLTEAALHLVPDLFSAYPFVSNLKNLHLKEKI